jgi:hypothetical protein
MEGKCDLCKKEAILKKCTACGIFAYCSKNCQVKDWKDKHSKNCAFLPENLRGFTFIYTYNPPVSSELLTEGIPFSWGDIIDKASFSNQKKLEYKASVITKDLNSDPLFYFHGNKGLTKRDYIINFIGTTIVLDSNLFIQLYSWFTSKLSNDILFGDFGFSTELSGSWLLYDILSVNAKYISILDEEVYELVYSYVGIEIQQWIVGPDKNKRYLGMSTEGPARLTFEDWVEVIAADILDNINDVEEEEIRELLRSIFVTYKADKKNWSLVSKPLSPIGR